MQAGQILILFICNFSYDVKSGNNTERTRNLKLPLFSPLSGILKSTTFFYNQFCSLLRNK